MKIIFLLTYIFAMLLWLGYQGADFRLLISSLHFQ